MAKTNKKTSIGDLISDIKGEINSLDSINNVIPDIMTFCEDKNWLGLPHHPYNPIRLYPMQKILLLLLIYQPLPME